MRLLKRVKKKYILSIAVLLLGLGLSIYLSEEEKANTRVQNDTTVIKNEWEEGDLKLKLVAGFDEDEETYEMAIKKREYTEEEFETMYISFLNEIELLIKGENLSLSKVSQDLRLQSTYAEYPFKVRWESSNEEIIDGTGAILRPWDDERSHEITLNGTCTYLDYRRTFEVRVLVVPVMMTDRQSFTYRLGRELQALDEGHETDKQLNLPISFDGISLRWTEKKSGIGIWIILGSLLLAILVQVASEYDERRKRKELEQRLAEEYPAFVERLRLYVISGMTVKNALAEIAGLLSCEGTSPLLEPLKSALNKLGNGVGEEQVYEELGAVCGEDYRKLSFILTVHLRKGNDRIIALLEDETRDARLKKSQLCRRRAEEAGVKLLFPMTVMLILVMGLIMIPVYIDFY